MYGHVVLVIVHFYVQLVPNELEFRLRNVKLVLDSEKKTPPGKTRSVPETRDQPLVKVRPIVSLMVENIKCCPLLECYSPSPQRPKLVSDLLAPLG